MIAQTLRRFSARGNEAALLDVRFVIAVETALAVALGLFLLGDKSFWLDESWSVGLAKLGWADLWREFNEREANQALYIVLLRPWLSLGTDEATVRGLSVIFAAATIPLIYLLASRLFSTRAGLVAGLLMAVNAFFIHYAQEARGYSLVLMLVTASSYLFVLALESPTRRRFLAYTLVSSLAVYAHFFAGLVVVAHVSSLLFLGLDNVPWRKWIVSGALMALLVAPLAVFVLFKSGGQFDWLAHPSPRSVSTVLVGLAGGRAPAMAYALACAVGCFAALRTWRASGLSWQAWRYGVLLTWLFVPLAIMFVVAQFSPVFLTRFFAVCLPALVVLAAVGVSQLGNRAVLGAATAMCVLVSLYGVASWYYDGVKEDWRAASAHVLSSSEPGDAVVFFSPWARTPFDYYRDRAESADADLFYADYATGDVVARWTFGGTDAPPVSESLGADLSRRFSRVWLVVSIPGVPNARALHEKARLIEAALEKNYSAVGEEHFQAITVLRYER